MNSKNKENAENEQFLVNSKVNIGPNAEDLKTEIEKTEEILRQIQKEQIAIDDILQTKQRRYSELEQGSITDLFKSDIYLMFVYLKMMQNSLGCHIQKLKLLSLLDWMKKLIKNFRLRTPS